MGFSQRDGGFNRFRVVAIYSGDHMPAIGFKALRCIVGKPAFYMAVDGNTVVIVKAINLPRPKVPAKEQTSWEIPSIKQPSPKKQ